MKLLLKIIIFGILFFVQANLFIILGTSIEKRVIFLDCEESGSFVILKHTYLCANSNEK